jgi:hypothetical protein
MARTIWQDLYAMQVDTDETTLSAHLAATPGFAAAGDVGVQGAANLAGKFLLPLNDHPNFKSPSGVVDTEQARGISPRHDGEYDTVVSGEPVEFALPLNAHAYNIAAFLPLFFQTGAVESAHSVGALSLNRLVCTPYSLADTQYFAYLRRHVQPASGSDAIDLAVSGAIASALNFSGESGGVITQEVTIQGAKWEQADYSGKVTQMLAAGFDKAQSLKYQDSQIAIEDVYSVTEDIAIGALTFADADPDTIVRSSGDFTTNLSAGDFIYVKGSAQNDGRYEIDTVVALTITLAAGETLAAEVNAGVVTIAKVNWVTTHAPSINFTLSNNPTFNFYNDDVASSVHLGRLTVEGAITIPFGQATVGENYMISRFLNGAPLRIAWYWGQSGAAVNHETDFDLNDSVVGPERYKNDSSSTDPRNFFSIVVNAMVTDYEMAGDNELQVECTLSGVNDSVNNAVEIYTAYFDELLDRIDA